MSATRIPAPTPFRLWYLAWEQLFYRAFSYGKHATYPLRTEADTSNPGCQTASCLGKPTNARTAPRCRLGSNHKAENASEDSLRGPACPQRKDSGTPPAFAIGLMARDGKPTGTQDQMMPCATARHRVAPSLAHMWDRDSRVTNQPSGVLGLQPLLGLTVLHVHHSIQTHRAVTCGEDPFLAASLWGRAAATAQEGQNSVYRAVQYIPYWFPKGASSAVDIRRAADPELPVRIPWATLGA